MTPLYFAGGFVIGLVTMLIGRHGARVKERERCAKIAEEFDEWSSNYAHHMTPEAIAAKIRQDA